MAKGVFWSLRFLLLLGLGGIIVLLSFTSPYQDDELKKLNIPMIATFLAAVFAFAFAFFSLLLLKVRKKALLRNKEVSLDFGISLRQGFLISLAAVVILVLQSFRVLTWWDGMLAMGAIMMLELYFLVK